MQAKKIRYAIIGIMLLALFVRAFNPGGLSGGDDSSYGAWVYYAFKEPFRFIYLDIPDEPTWHTNSAFLRNFSLWPMAPFVYLFGFHTWPLRMASLLFSLASIPLLYILVKRHFNTKICLLACFLFAVSPLHVAFTRVAYIDGALTFYALLFMYFIVTATEAKKTWMYYAAALVGIVTLLTTYLRGAVPMTAVIPFILLSKPTKKQWVHLIAAGSICIGAYILYPLIPLLWGDGRFWERFIYLLINGPVNQGYSHSDTFFALLKYLYVTPFLGIILVPAIFGAVHLAKDWKKPFNMLVLGYIATTIIFYINGQPVPSRQSSLVPAYAILAAVALSNVKKGSLYRLTAAYLFFIIPVSLAVIPEFAGFKSSTISITGTQGFNILVLLIFFACIALCTIPFFDSKILAQRRYLTAGYLFFSLALVIGLVIGGFGVFHRSDEINKVAEYMADNLDGEAYGCVAGIHEKTLRYLLKRDCATWRSIDIAWLEEQKSKGALKYFVLNHEYKYGTVGLGEVLPNGTVQDYVPGTLEEFHEDMYNWLMQNTIDVTSQSGVDPGRFTIRQMSS